MSSDPKFSDAKKLIDEFAAHLLALNDNKTIPSHWQICLKNALTPKPAKAGRKLDFFRVSETVKYLVLCAGELRSPRTKNFSPTKFKDKIAQKNRISRKTVERHMELIPEIFAMKPDTDEENIKHNLDLIIKYLDRIKSEPPELRDAIRRGIREAKNFYVHQSTRVAERQRGAKPK